MATQTAVTWNGTAFEPLEHDDYKSARGYVAEFVAFHATEVGYRARRIEPDVWRITGSGGTIVIRIQG